MRKEIKEQEAINTIMENMAEEQKDFIIENYLWEECTYDLTQRLNRIKGFKNHKVIMEVE